MKCGYWHPRQGRAPQGYKRWPSMNYSPQGTCSPAGKGHYTPLSSTPPRPRTCQADTSDKQRSPGPVNVKHNTQPQGQPGPCALEYQLAPLQVLSPRPSLAHWRSHHHQLELRKNVQHSGPLGIGHPEDLGLWTRPEHTDTQVSRAHTSTLVPCYCSCNGAQQPRAVPTPARLEHDG